MIYIVYDNNINDGMKLIRSFSNKEEAEKYADFHDFYLDEILYNKENWTFGDENTLLEIIVYLKSTTQEIEYAKSRYCNVFKSIDFQLFSDCDIYAIVDKPDKKIYHIEKFIFTIPVNINNNPTSEIRLEIIEEYKKLCEEIKTIILNMLSTQKQSPKIVKQWFIDNFKHPDVVLNLVKNNPKLKEE